MLALIPIAVADQALALAGFAFVPVIAALGFPAAFLELAAAFALARRFGGKLIHYILAGAAAGLAHAMLAALFSRIDWNGADAGWSMLLVWLSGMPYALFLARAEAEPWVGFVFFSAPMFAGGAVGWIYSRVLATSPRGG